MRRLAVLLALVVAGCGSSGDSATTTTVTTTDTTPGGAATTPPPRPPAASHTGGERIGFGDLLMFRTPSGRIGCAVSRHPATLRCDTAFPTLYSHAPHECAAGDYGQAFELSASGPARAICAGDTVLSAPGARTIPYGRTWLLGPFRCVSRSSGLTCTRGSHGLALSLERQKLY